MGIVALLDERIIGLACNIEQAGDFATKGRRLRREPVSRSPNEEQLARELLGIAIRSSQRSSVGDVRTTISLFRMEKDTLRGIM